MTTQTTTPDTTPVTPSEELREHAKAVRKDLTNLGRAAKTVAQEKLDTTRQHAGKWEGKFEGFIREQPVKSMLIAAGAGAVLGWLLRRR